MQDLSSRSTLLAILLLLAGIAVLASGCESNTESNVSTYFVTYLLQTELGSPTGSADINRILYNDETGTVDLALDPAVQSWSESVVLAPGDTIYMGVEGSFDSARAVLQIQVQGDDGSAFARSANGMPISTGDFSVEIPQETLP